MNNNKISRFCCLFRYMMPLFLSAGMMFLPPEGVYAQQEGPEVYTSVEEMPELVGGLPELYKHIKYPPGAVRAGIEGRVFIQFIVDETGNVSDPVVLRDIGGGCGEAALEAIQKVEFTPGRHNGEPVRVKFSLPVTFQIQS